MVRKAFSVYSCFNIHTDSGLQFDRILIRPDSNFLHPAPYQCLTEFREFSRLTANEILKRCDAIDLFVSCYRVNGGLLFQFPEPENLIGNLIVGFLAVGLLEKLLLKLQQLLIDGIRGCGG